MSSGELQELVIADFSSERREDAFRLRCKAIIEVETARAALPKGVIIAPRDLLGHTYQIRNQIPDTVGAYL